jgi:sulfite dehydrogenase
LISSKFDRREFLRNLGLATLSATAFSLPTGFLGQQHDEDPILAGRPLVKYPEKDELILLTSRPPQLETPMSYFKNVITPNKAFYVRYHIPPPESVDLNAWRLKIGGNVRQPLSLSMEELRSKFTSRRIVAVNQCSGNSRGRFSPRVFGGQWGDGAMGNAAWTGVSLQDLLDRAGLKDGSLQVTFNGLDQPVLPQTPDLVKALTVGHIQSNPDIMIAYEMNDEALPMLNGFPARLVVPGWFGTYWVKNLADINVLDSEFQGFWFKTAYRIPDNPCACVLPGMKPAGTVPINRMDVRSFIISPAQGDRVKTGLATTIQGIAFDGGYGISDVVVSTNGGQTWKTAKLGSELSPYSFRAWSFEWKPPRAGEYRLMARATNRFGESQPLEPRWNPSGYMRNVVEKVEVRAD